MTKPTSSIDWGVGNTDPINNIIEPSVAKKISAWAVSEKPPSQFFNWLFFNIDEWIKFLEAKTDSLADVVIGSGSEATHATLAAAVADVTLGANVVVTIMEDYTVETVIALTKVGWRINFRPGVTYTKGGGAPTECLSLDAANIVINYGRFIGWTVGGDKAIEQTVNGDYCIVSGSVFGATTDTEIDQTAVGAGKAGPISNTITEV